MSFIFYTFLFLNIAQECHVCECVITAHAKNVRSSSLFKELCDVAIK